MNFLRRTSFIQQRLSKWTPGPALIPGDAMEEFVALRQRMMAEYAKAGDSFMARRIGATKTMRQMLTALQNGGLLPVGGAAERCYVLTSGSSAVSTSAKVAFQLATGATVTNWWMAFDLSQNAALNATTQATQLDFQRTTAASSGGAAGTVNKLNASVDIAANTTARINDTTNGTSPTTLFSFFVPVTSGFSYEFPLAREFTMTNSAFQGALVTGATGVSANYIANVYFAE